MSSFIVIEDNSMNEIDTIVKQVISNMKNERESQNRSQLELANSADISQSFLASIEANNKIPTITTVIKIAKALNVNPSTFFDMSPDKLKIKKEIKSLIDQI